MKLKQAMRYQLRGIIRPTLIYYAITILVYVAFAVIALFVQTGAMYRSGGELTSAIFLLVLGMNSFKTPFYLFLQNGISRKTLLTGFLLTSLIVSTGVWAIDSLFPRLFSGLVVESLYDVIYRTGSGFLHFINDVAWTVLLGFSALCAGFLITTLYYNMNKVIKVIVSAGVPIALFIIIPIIETFVPTFTFYSSLMRFIGWCLGADSYATVPSLTMNSIRPLLCFATFSAVASGLSFLLIRRTTIKE